MFYVLIVYENGTVQQVQTSDMREAEALVSHARTAPGATFVQWGAWPFGPAFGTEVVERPAPEKADAEAEPDFFTMLRDQLAKDMGVDPSQIVILGL